MEELLALSFALKSDLFTTVRLTAGGICARAGLSLDDAEDCKVCVTESLLLFMRNGYSSARVQFAQDNGVCVRLTGENGRGAAGDSAEDEISYSLLGAWVENLNVERKDGAVTEITFRFGS